MTSVLAPLSRGDWRARLAQDDADLDAAQNLRRARFRGGATGKDDRDRFDLTASHVLVEGPAGLAATYRVHLHTDARAAAEGYTGQFYDLGSLAGLGGPLVEMGRFCISPEAGHPDVLRLAWGAMTSIVDRAGATLLFGCASFPGQAPDSHRIALDWLARHHLGPDALRPRARAARSAEIDRPGAALAPGAQALAALPPLLRSYLGLGGWVSDRAVSDPDLDTLHVFVGVETAKVPPARARALRALTQDARPGAD